MYRKAGQFLIIFLIPFNIVWADGSDAGFDILKSYYAYDKRPLEAQTLATTEQAAEVRETVTFTSFDGEKIVGYLSRPKGVENPPVIIAMHGITQSKQQWWATEGDYSFPGRHQEALSARGFAVLALDARNHGDRILENDFKDLNVYFLPENFYSYQKMVSQSAIDVRRAIDYVESRADLNTDNLGIVGFSMGGHISWIATAVDARIKTSLIIGMPLDENVGDFGFVSPSKYLPGLKGRTLKMLVATNDHFGALPAAQALFAKIPSDHKAITIVEGAHDMPDATSQISSDWFK